MDEIITYFVFKLVSGEEVVAATRIDDTGVEPAFFLTKPLKVALTHKGTNTLVRLVPWITIPDEDREVYSVGFDKIITMTELEADHEMTHAYNHYNLSFFISFYKSKFMMISSQLILQLFVSLMISIY